MKTKLLNASAVIALAVAGGAIAASDPMVGGAPMLDNKNIIQNAVNSKDHTTLVAAVKAGGLADTLQGPGPLTVFAPTNAAFAALPAGTVGTLLKPENKDTLDKILTYHVVPGRLDSATLWEAERRSLVASVLRSAFISLISLSCTECRVTPYGFTRGENTLPGDSRDEQK